MERIGIFGGTFNPVHSGHLLLARHYLDALKLDRLLVIPTGTPPHKDAPELLDGENGCSCVRWRLRTSRGCSCATSSCGAKAKALRWIPSAGCGSNTRRRSCICWWAAICF